MVNTYYVQGLHLQLNILMCTKLSLSFCLMTILFTNAERCINSKIIANFYAFLEV